MGISGTPEGPMLHYGVPGILWGSCYPIRVSYSLIMGIPHTPICSPLYYGVPDISWGSWRLLGTPWHIMGSLAPYRVSDPSWWPLSHYGIPETPGDLLFIMGSMALYGIPGHSRWLPWLIMESLTLYGVRCTYGIPDPIWWPPIHCGVPATLWGTPGTLWGPRNLMGSLTPLGTPDTFWGPWHSVGSLAPPGDFLAHYGIPSSLWGPKHLWDPWPLQGTPDTLWGPCHPMGSLGPPGDPVTYNGISGISGDPGTFWGPCPSVGSLSPPAAPQYIMGSLAPPGDPWHILGSLSLCRIPGPSCCPPIHYGPSRGPWPWWLWCSEIRLSRGLLELGYCGYAALGLDGPGGPFQPESFYDSISARGIACCFSNKL